MCGAGQAISRVGGRDFQKEIENLKAAQPSIDTAEGKVVIATGLQTSEPFLLLNVKDCCVLFCTDHSSGHFLIQPFR